MLEKLKITFWIFFSGVRDFLCHLCNKAYPTKNKLDEHLMMKHAEELGVDAPKDWVCNICGKAFFSGDFLNDAEIFLEFEKLYFFSRHGCWSITYTDLTQIMDCAKVVWNYIQNLLSAIDVIMVIFVLKLLKSI